MIFGLQEKMLKMLTDPTDGYRYSEFSNKSVNFSCPNIYCKNNLAKKIISVVSTEGLSCRRCGDGTSYPNNFRKSKKI